MTQMISVRAELGVLETSVSVRQWAEQHNLSFPLSLRKSMHSVPAGHILRKVIPLDVLQRKFDEFLNFRSRPPFLIRLNGTQYGESTVTVTFDDPVKGFEHDPFINAELAKPGEALEFDGIVFGTHRFYFQDVKSDEMTLKIFGTGPLVLEAILHFETGGGVELHAEDFPDINFEHFSISMKIWVEPDFLNHSISLGTYPEWVSTDVSVDVSALPDGKVADKIESTMNSKIYAALDENLPNVISLLKTWLIGGDYYVLMVGCNDQALTIHYILPEGLLEPFPENPQPPLDPGLLKNIEHIVVVMMENRSFDHMLGYLSKEGHSDGTKRPDVDGLQGGERNPYKGRDYPSFPLTGTVFENSPCHSFDCVLNQVDADKMDGFIADYANHYEASGADPGEIMGYYTSATLPVYDALAREFLVCDRWFSAHPGPTFCNRFYTLTGRLNRDANGRFEFSNPHGSDFIPVSTRTIFDHLNDHGVTWRYYEHGYCFLRMFERYTFDNQNIVDGGPDSINFVRNALDGFLPSVTFIDPDFIDVPPGFDDGPPADIAAGQHFIGTVVDALIKGHIWNRTLLIVTYDEHGGFFDHVPPPEAIPVSAINRYGVRVPTFIISPWVDKGKVSNVIFDHTSIAKTIARCFMSTNPPDMGERMAAANDLSMVLSPTMRMDRPSIPVPPAPVPKSALALRAIQDMEDEQDFKGVLRAIRARYPTPA